MKLSEKLSENLNEYIYIFKVGNHTTSGYLTIKIYKENYIIDLYNTIKEMIKGTRIKTKRYNKVSEIKELNNLLSVYIKDQQEYLNDLLNLSFVNDEFINMKQMQEVCTIGNNHGRIGSGTASKFKKVEQIICQYENIIETLKDNKDGLLQIAI